MAMGNEERVARRFIDAFNRRDFNAAEFAYYFTRAGWLFQEVMWKVIMHMMEFWANDLEKGEDKGHEPYFRQTVFAAQIFELMQQQQDSIEED